MRRKAEAPQVRRNLLIPHDLIEKLPELQLRTEASSDSDVIRRALTCYEEIVEDAADKIRLYSVRPDGRDVTITDELEQVAVGTIARANKVNLIFHGGAERRFEALRGKVGAASDSEIVERALRLYVKLLNEVDAGGALQISYPNGHVEAVRLVGVPRRPTSAKHRSDNPVPTTA